LVVSMPRKWFKRGPGAWSAWGLMHGLRLLLQVLPLSWIEPMGSTLGAALYRFMGPRRDVALANLRTALGTSVDPARRRRILRCLSRHLGVMALELGHPRYLGPQSMRRFVALSGKEHLETALGRGRGAILVTAHFGNFPLMLARLALEDYLLGVIIRAPRHRPTARFLDEWRSRFGIVTLRDKPRRASVRDALHHLKRNGVLVVHIDLNASRKDLYVPFFGQWVPTFRGPAALSLRTDAPLLPAFIYRVAGLHHRIEIQPGLEIPHEENPEERSWKLLLDLTRAAEETIRRHPEQWWWMHRRFRKARPPEEVGRPLPEIRT